MTQPDKMELLLRKVAELGQAEVARQIGYSASAVNQALKDTYKGDLSNLLRRVEEVFGGTVVHCPVLGEIPLTKCAEHKRRPFAATNPQRVRMYRACRDCGKGGK